MRKIAYSFILLFLTISVFAFEYPFDSSLPINTLDENSKVTFLNARFGSRFSFSYASAERGMHTGALGFDQDDFREMLVMVELDGQMACFRTSALLENAIYLQNQTIQQGLNGLEWKGTHPKGAVVRFTLVSPFTPSASLEDLKALQVQISPAYYLQISVQNTSGKTLKGNVFVGFKSIPYDRNREGAMSVYPRFKLANQLFFKDPGRGQENQITLASVDSLSKNLYHHQYEAFHGLRYALELDPNRTQEQVYVYATHYAGKALIDEKRNRNLKFYYNKFWKDINHVLAYARLNFKENIRLTGAFENLLKRSKLSGKDKWLIALSFRTDLANCFLVMDDEQQPGFYEVEGRFRHTSTVDVAMETELNAVFAPWRLKLQLEQWSDYLATKEVPVYSSRTPYSKKANMEGVTASEYGFFIYHDVGDYPYLYNAEGYNFGPCSPVEENSSFVMLLYWYLKITGDKAFVQRHLGMVDAVLYSNSNRDSDGSGIADGGIGWTTYDVSDAIKRAPENTYLGVKEMVAYLLGAEMLKNLYVLPDQNAQKILIADDEDGTTLDGNQKATFIRAQNNNQKLRQLQALRYEKEAAKIAKTILNTSKKFGYIPVSLDKNFKGWDQYSITICEGLYFPALTGFDHPIIQSVLPALKKNHMLALAKSTKPYGINLSSGEQAVWFSKAMVADIVSSKYFGVQSGTATHAYEWNKNNPSAYQDGTYDGIKPWEGNWYPRGVVSVGFLFQENNLAQNPSMFLNGLK